MLAQKVNTTIWKYFNASTVTQSVARAAAPLNAWLASLDSFSIRGCALRGAQYPWFPAKITLSASAVKILANSAKRLLINAPVVTSLQNTLSSTASSALKSVLEATSPASQMVQLANWSKKMLFPSSSWASPSWQCLWSVLANSAWRNCTTKIPWLLSLLSFARQTGST